MLTFETSCLHGDIINVNPDHFVHITASARPHGAVKNCSLFELVKTNNQDQRKGDKIKPQTQGRVWSSGTDWVLGALFICGLRFVENIHHHPHQLLQTLAYLEEGAIMGTRRLNPRRKMQKSGKYLLSLPLTKRKRYAHGSKTCLLIVMPSLSVCDSMQR